jgi:hypothetical protein
MSTTCHLLRSKVIFSKKMDFFGQRKLKICFFSNLFAQRKYVHIPKLSLSNLIHKLNFLNESLSVALADLAELSDLLSNLENSLIAYFIGNIYVVIESLSLLIFNSFVNSKSTVMPYSLACPKLSVGQLFAVFIEYFGCVMELWNLTIKTCQKVLQK